MTVAVEHVASYPREVIASAFGNRLTVPLEELPERVGAPTFAPRALVERDSSRVQLVSVAAVIQPVEGLVMAVRKAATAVSEESVEAGQMLLYMGGHANITDRGDTLDRLAAAALQRELEEEAVLRGELRDGQLAPLAIWDASGAGSSPQHFAVVHFLETSPCTSPVQPAGSELSSIDFLPLEAVSRGSLEPWSCVIHDQLSALFSGPNRL